MVPSGGNPTQVTAYVVSGVGFLAAGGQRVATGTTSPSNFKTETLTPERWRMPLQGRATIFRMAQHTTCYIDTFITMAPDSKAVSGVDPPIGAAPSVAAQTYMMIAAAPYAHTSDDVIFTVWADRHDIPDRERPAARAAFFSTGRACLRASDLTKRYGWGIHSDAQGRVALYPASSPEYASFASGVSPHDGTPVTVKAAMRNSRAETA